MTDVDVVIVGAGAAGIGAGLALRQAGLSCIILEAASRVGGRAFTDTHSLPSSWDHGCHWMHCADVNPLVPWADRVGARYLRQVRPDHSMYWSDGGWLDTAAARQANTVTGEAFGAVYAAAAQGDDVAISDVLPDAGRWARGVRHILQLMTSEDPEYVSAEAYADYEDTDVNWPVISGYGDLITRLASGLPVRLGVAVESVEEESGGVRVRSAQGEIRAGAAIVTTSTNVLNAGGIRFGSGPARDLLEKIAEVPCGAYEKVAIALRRPVIGEADSLFCMIDPGDGASPANFQVHGPERRVLIAHLGGSLAREIARGGPQAMRDYALARLSLAFGADVLSEVEATATTDWLDNPWVRGAYSYARPGHATTRREMIAAETGPIAFAGEAFSMR